MGGQREDGCFGGLLRFGGLLLSLGMDCTATRVPWRSDWGSPGIPVTASCCLRGGDFSTSTWSKAQLHSRTDYKARVRTSLNAAPKPGH